MKNGPFAILTVLAILNASAFAQQRPPNSADEAAIRALEQQWDTANLKGDAASLETLFADAFISTDSQGVVRTKAEVVGAVKAGKIKYDSSHTEQVKVILYTDAAVVSGTWRGNYTHENRAVNLVERFTNFYVRQRGQWRCVASHGSAIR